MTSIPRRIRNCTSSFHMLSEIERHSLSLFQKGIFLLCLYLCYVCNVKGIVTINENKPVREDIICDFYQMGPKLAQNRYTVAILSMVSYIILWSGDQCFGITLAMITYVNINDFACDKYRGRCFVRGNRNWKGMGIDKKCVLYRFNVAEHRFRFW